VSDLIKGIGSESGISSTVSFVSVVCDVSDNY